MDGTQPRGRTQISRLEGFSGTQPLFPLKYPAKLRPPPHREGETYREISPMLLESSCCWKISTMTAAYRGI
jgi:hypothetical protein